MTRRALDARYLAGPVVDAAFDTQMYVVAFIEDARAASAEGDAPTAIVCLEHALLWLMSSAARFDQLPGSGPPGPATAAAAAVFGRDEHIALLERLEATAPVDRRGVSELFRDIEGAVEAFIHEIPISFPEVRTPTGFFPTVRVMRQVERLRRQLGLPPYAWDFGR